MADTTLLEQYKRAVDGERTAALQEILGALRPFHEGQFVNVPIEVNVCSGEKAR